MNDFLMDFLKWVLPARGRTRVHAGARVPGGLVFEPKCIESWTIFGGQISGFLGISGDFGWGGAKRNLWLRAYRPFLHQHVAFR